MSKEFLGQILTLENSVLSDVGQACPICLEAYGSISSETGIIECGVRLPCSHVVGSACIALWLNANNNCPLCRNVFFPRQPRPYLEDGIMQDAGDDEDAEEDEDEDEDGQGEDEDDYADIYPIVYLTRWTDQLNLSLEVVRLSENIISKSDRLNELASCTPVSIAAASLYIGSHLRGQPLFLGEISRVAGISRGTIQDVYRKIHADRFNLIDEAWMELFEDPTMGQTAEALGSLPWPSLEFEILDGESDEEEESDE